MRMYDLIRKKRDGERLAKEEIDWMIRSYTNGKIPDYQMSALMMAIYFRGMNEQETLNLTIAMADSGERLDLSAIHGIKVAFVLTSTMVSQKPTPLTAVSA